MLVALLVIAVCPAIQEAFSIQLINKLDKKTIVMDSIPSNAVLTWLKLSLMSEKNKELRRLLANDADLNDLQFIIEVDGQGGRVLENDDKLFTVTDGGKRPVYVSLRDDYEQEAEPFLSFTIVNQNDQDYDQEVFYDEADKQGTILELKQWLSTNGNDQEEAFTDQPPEKQILTLHGKVLADNAIVLQVVRNGDTVYFDFIKPVQKVEAAQVEQESKREKVIKSEEPTKAHAPSKSVPSAKIIPVVKSTLKKPIRNMTSKEVGQLKFGDLTESEREEVMNMALFSGLESHRNAARKVIDLDRTGNQLPKIEWEKMK